MVGKIAIIASILLMLFAGCAGQPAQTAAPATPAAPAATTAAPTTPAPATTAPPKVDIFLITATQPTEVIASGYTKVEPLSSAEWDYEPLRFPPKPSSYKDGIKATYGEATKRMYVLKFETPSAAESFYSAIIEKYSRTGSAPLVRSITSSGKTIQVHVRSDPAAGYMGTLHQRGMFIYFIKMGSTDFDTEQFMRDNMKFLFE